MQVKSIYLPHPYAPGEYNYISTSREWQWRCATETNNSSFNHSVTNCCKWKSAQVQIITHKCLNLQCCFSVILIWCPGRRAFQYTINWNAITTVRGTEAGSIWGIKVLTLYRGSVGNVKYICKATFRIFCRCIINLWEVTVFWMLLIVYLMGWILFKFWYLCVSGSFKVNLWKVGRKTCGETWHLTANWVLALLSRQKAKTLKIEQGEEDVDGEEEEE